MHALRTFLAPICIAALAQGSHAQIVIEATDQPVVGDEIVRYRDTIPAFGPGGSGAMQVWDFSAALLHETVTTSVVAPATTPSAASFTGSNLAMTNGDGAYLYFDLGSAAMVSTGAAGDLLGDGQNIVTVFDPSLLLHPLPRTYGDHFTDGFYFEATASGSAFGVHSVRLRHHGTVFDSTDAYGELTTPVGTYDVLRVKTTGHSVDSLWFKLLSFAPWTFFQALEDTSISYAWLAKETKMAVAEMTLDSLGAPARFVYSSVPPAITTGNDREAVAGVRVHPVPASAGFTLSLARAGSHTSATVFASDGRIVQEVPLATTGSQWVATGQWPPGLYHVRLLPVGTGPPTIVRVVVE